MLVCSSKPRPHSAPVNIVSLWSVLNSIDGANKRVHIEGSPGSLGIRLVFLRIMLPHGQAANGRNRLLGPCPKSVVAFQWTVRASLTNRHVLVEIARPTWHIVRLSGWYIQINFSFAHYFGTAALHQQFSKVLVHAGLGHSVQVDIGQILVQTMQYNFKGYEFVVVDKSVKCLVGRLGPLSCRVVKY
ncbi:hypothetical protein BpHYR1_050836 [Brachionus plicatilis]|uniref:Uncharacterized protein n=1 Tax=Brachionus plicatilis TaxID=10195 RepID=A0A3M7PA63_BRAPC|nr:hypothetical protein BpHYR1_050836 [Brachionus plicatilis]